MGDKVSKPKQTNRSGGLKYGPTSAIKGPSPSVANANPYNHKNK